MTTAELISSGGRGRTSKSTRIVGLRFLGTTVLVAAGFWAFVEAADAIELTGPGRAIAPATGLGIAVLYCYGRRWWPALLLGELVAVTPVSDGRVLVEVAGEVAGMFAAASILILLVGRRARLDRLSQVCALMIAVASGAAISATVAVGGGGPDAWSAVWFGALCGGLVVIPLLIVWTPPANTASLGRRGRAEAGLLVVATVALTVVANSFDEPLIELFVPILIWAGVRFGARGATATVALTVFVTTVSREVRPGGVLEFQLHTVLASLTALCVAIIVAERRRSALELADSRARVLAAGDATRRQIERDLHDGAQQQLVGLRVRLGLADDLLERDPDRAHQLLAEAGAAVEDTIAEVRSLGAGIYPPLLTDCGLADALRSLGRHASVPVRVTVDGSSRFAPEIEAAVYFCCSEALQNASKHGGRGTQATVALSCNGALDFEVIDDGQGFVAAPERSGRGLHNMRDRIEAVGGTVAISSAPGAGTTVRGRVDPS